MNLREALKTMTLDAHNVEMIFFLYYCFGEVNTIDSICGPNPTKKDKVNAERLLDVAIYAHFAKGGKL